jgi:hypothetical protein
MDLVITSFLLIIIPNTCGFILWLSNLVCLVYFRISKHLLKHVSKPKSKDSDNGGEFIALKSYLSLHGIGHYTTAPHTLNKTVSLNVGVAILLKSILHCFMMPLNPSHIGPMRFKRPHIS